MKKLKHIILFSTTLFLTFLLPSTTSAFNILGGSYSDGNINYYIDQSMIDMGMYGYAAHGARAWNPSPYVEFTRTTSTGNAQVFMKYVSYSIGSTVIADTLNYKYVSGYGYVPDNSSTYARSIIRFGPNFHEMRNSGTTGVNHAYETAAHEVGHALGLDHPDMWQPNRIMIASGWAESRTPLSDDWDGVTYIYK